MNRTRPFHRLALLLALLLGVSATPLRAQTGFSQEQLEQIVAPIALYPDNLLTQVLMASSYPLEVVEADRWVRQNADLAGPALDEAMKDQDWDASVKGLAHVPNVLFKMSENLDWTQDLGDAFLAQQTELMDTIQRMRGKAYDAGNLESGEQQVVTKQSDQIIVIESPDPQVIYVPSYSPTVVYGGWSYPSYYYPPMYYPPPAGYGLLAFGTGMAIGGAIWGDADWGWGNSDVDIDVDRYNEFNRNTSRDWDRTRIDADRGGNRANWQHNPSHRKGVNYRDQNVGQRFGATSGSNRVSRDQARGFSQNRGMNADVGQRATAPRNVASGQFDRSHMDRPGANRSGGSFAGRDSAFSGSRNAGFDRSASMRGSTTSRGASSFGGSGMRGGGGGMRGGGGRR